jgi:phosphoribosylformimino-5-aminoimidazole carboxamide ribotide isomerase
VDQIDNSRSLLAPDAIAKLVGVIDLQRGQAVHAVAGDRAHYQPVEFVRGSAGALQSHYRSLGLSKLYIADLDAIQRGTVQLPVLEQLLTAQSTWDQWLLDLGSPMNDQNSLQQLLSLLTDRQVDYRLILATESARSLSELDRLVERVPADRVLLGMDYRGDRLISDAGDEGAWLEKAKQLGISGAVVLDVKSVGTGDITSAIGRCTAINRIAPWLTIYSGGGVGNATDLAALQDVGCDWVLVATALQR